MNTNKVCCLGAGHLGGIFSSVLALKCPDIEVQVIDENEEKINKWNSDRIPVFERDINDIVAKCRGRNLFFTSDINHLKSANIIFVCTEVNSRFTKSTESTEMKALENAARLIVRTVESSKIIVEKSAVAIRATDMMESIFRSHQVPYRNFTVISNPEFLTEGCAVNELLNPERVLIGGDNTMRTAKAIEALVSIYDHWVPRSKIITSDMWSTELSNLTQIAFTAQTITGINSIAEVCESMNVDISQVVEAVAMDPRIGIKHLGKNIGFRGITFAGTIESIIYMCKCLKLPEVASYWQKLLDINNYLKQTFAAKIMDSFSNNITDRSMTVLGFSSRNSQDSAVFYILKVLLENGARLKIFDPLIPKEEIRKDLTDLFGDSILLEKLSDYVEIFNDAYEAAKEAEAIIVCMDWPQLMVLDFHKIYDAMTKPPYIFDGNYLLQHRKLQGIGFHVRALGKSLAPKLGKNAS